MRRSIGYITAVGVIGLCVALTGCTSKPSSGGSNSSRAVKARRDAESLAVDAATAGATVYATTESARAETAQASFVAKTTPRPRSTPRPGSTPVLRETVSSLIYAPEPEAEKDARERARELVKQKFLELDPPLRYEPTLAEVEAEFIRKDSRALIPADEQTKATYGSEGLPTNVVKVAYDVEVSAEQVRALRSQDRVSTGLRVLGAVMAVALAGFLFLRADEWTKGYLTSWLALGAVTLAGAAAAALIFI